MDQVNIAMQSRSHMDLKGLHGWHLGAGHLLFQITGCFKRKRNQECYLSRFFSVALETPKVEENNSTAIIRRMIDPSSFSTKVCDSASRITIREFEEKNQMRLKCKGHSRIQLQEILTR